MGGEEAKARSSDNCFKEFSSRGGPRNEAVSGENKAACVCLLRQEICVLLEMI